MEIDWITLGAQAVNFLVLVFLLHHFLYGRIVTAVDRREEKIQGRLDEAREKEKEAREEAEAHRRERRELREKRDELLREARQAAEEEREERLRDIRAEAAAERDRWHDRLRREKADLLAELRDRAARTTRGIAEATLADLADEDLHHRTVTTFLRRVREAGDESDLVDAASRSGGVVVHSAFELDGEARERIRQHLRDDLGVGDPIEFEADPELVLGLRLEAGDREVQWSVRDRMRDLEEQVAGILDREEGRDA